MLSKNAETVLTKRYYLKNAKGEVTEVAEQMFRRVANFLAIPEKNIQKWSEEFFNIMHSLKFLPNSPTLANADARTGQLSACFVLPIPDDLREIFNTLRDAALIHQTGGGTGFAFTRLRPMNDFVKGNLGVSSGPVSFMDAYNAATESIKQGGLRRGANMGILRIDHPDIERFVSHKEDLSRLTNFNISVAVTDAFMVAVETGTTYQLINPRNNEVTAELDARTVFSTIVKRAWSTGEPGLVFIDRMNDYCPVPWMDVYEATNPCFIGSTVIKSPEGDITLRDLAERYAEYPVYAYDKSTDRTVVKMGRNPRMTGRKVEVLKLKTDDGREIVATPNHKFWVRNNANDSWEKGYWVELKDLQPGMSLTNWSSAINGKGHERVSTGKFHEGAHRLYAELMLNRKLGADEDVHHKNGNKLDHRWSNLEVMNHAEHSRLHKLGELNPNFADVTAEQLVERGRKVMAELGEGFTFRDYQAATRGEQGYGVKKVLTSFGTWASFKTAVAGNAKVMTIEPAGFEDVYNITVDDVHNYFANGMLVKNCGEQPLIPYESCNLGSINLEKFVTEEFEGMRGYEPPTIDWADLQKTVEISTSLLDNVIDQNVYPLPQIEAVTKATRKIGLGIMGFARMLFKLGVGYGTPESLVLAEQVFSFIDFHAAKTSIDLAKKKGAFPASIGHEYDSFEIQRRILLERDAHPNRHPEANYSTLIDDLFEYGIRNSTRTTIAPTGTLGIIADTSGGCEPVFALAFKRFQADTHMIDIDQVFATELLKRFSYSETKVIQLGVEAAHGSLHEYLYSEPSTWLDDTQRRILTELAGVFVTTHDITPIEHVNIQDAFQKYNDSATSKTINFPESATEEDVRTAYLHAWNTSCKGITVYRNNCRAFQPLSTGASKVEAPIPQVQQLATCCPTPNIVKSEGCTECKNCGWSACSVQG